MDSVSLAEPRRRQKWTLNPRGNLWANDESKFGQKLMEKMGWEKGKGLGAKENGRIEAISARLKDNNKGIGFEGHDDTWLAHQSDFQSVLAALNIQHGDAGKEMSETEKKANLEELSKKSKKRVHYQKFVRGKDTNNYSVDDLDCILGTKSDKVKKPKPEEEKEAEGEQEDDKKFVQGGSYADYFAKKMAALKAKGKFSSVDTDWVSSTPSAVKDDEDEVQRIGFSGTDSAAPDQADACPDNDEEPAKKKKKSKKSKKENKDEEDNVILSPSEVSEEVEASTEKSEKKKKKKSKKAKEEESEEPSLPAEDEAPKKKKKSKKNKETKDDVISLPEDVVQDVETSDKKQKKSKKKKREEEENQNEIVEPVLEEEEVKKKKSKKSKKEKVAQVEEAEEDSGLENDDTKYKKQKKVKKEKTKEKKTTYSDEEKENRKKRKSETEEETLSPMKKMKTAQEDENRTKFAGFKGSNLLAIPGYGVIES